MIIGTNFKLSSTKFLDDRQLCKDYATLIANAEGIIYPPGFEVFCEYENKYYQYVSDTNGGYVWEERKSGVSDGTSASIKDDTISEEYTWSSAHIDSMRIDLETLITQANDYVDEIDERMLFIEGKFQWFEYFDGSYDSLKDKPVIPTKVSELENDSEFLGIERLELELESVNEKIDTKIDKEEDRTLISVTELERLSTVDNYNDTEVRQLITELETQAHTHINSDILDSITEEKINQWDNNTGVDDYNYIQNKPIIRVGDDSDILLNFGQIIDEGMYIITAMVGEYKIHNELVHVKWADDDNVTLTIPNMFMVLNVNRTDDVWTIVNELHYGVDKENGKISDTLTIGEDKIILDKEGNGWFGGKVSQEGIPTEDKDLVTKGYVDNKFVTNERVSAIEKENARRDVIIEALANGRRRTVETDGNDVDLMFSTEKDKVWIDKIEGETLVNVCDQEEPIAITKSYTVEGTNHVPLQGEYDGKARPVVHGNTLVNHNVEYDKSVITGEKLDNTHGTEILNLEGTPGCEIKVDIDGHTAINLSTKKEDILCKSFDSASGNEINLVAEENSVSDLAIQGNTMVNLKEDSSHIALASDHPNGYINGNSSSLKCDTSSWDWSLATWYYINVGLPKIDMFKPNTKYTLCFKKTVGLSSVAICNGSGLESLVAQTPVIDNKVVFTTPSNLETETQMRLYGLGDKLNIDIELIGLFEGDLTQTPELIPTEYVEGLKSTFEDKLIPYSIYNGDNLTSITETQYQLPLTVKSNAQYTVTTTANTTKYQYAVYSTDGLTEYLSYDATVATQIFTCDTNNVLFKVRMNPSYEGNDYSFVLDEVKDKFLIVEGDWSSRLDLLTEEYFGKYKVDMSSTDNDTNEIITSKTVYLNSPLLNGDELLTKDGKLYHYHKMGKVVLDGSSDEGWGMANTQYTDTFSAYIDINNGSKTSSLLVNNLQVSDEFRFDTQGIYNNGSNANSTQLICRILKSSLATTDVNGFKQWLSENPTTVVYELASPYYEEISSTEDMRFNIASNSTIEYQSNVPMANTQFLPYRNELPLLESSTQYRVTFDCDVEGMELMVSLGGTSQTIISALHNELSFITPSLQTDGKLTIDGYGIAKIDNVLITKGDMEYKYFEGLKSGFEGNKVNLYDISKIKTDNNDSQAFSITSDNHMILKTNVGWDGFKINDLSNFKENTEYEIVVNVYKNELVGDERLYIISVTSETQTDKDIFYTDASNSINIIPGQLGKFTYHKTSLSDFSNCECVLRTVLNIGASRCVECTIEIYEVGVCKANIRIQNPNAPIFGKGGRL